MARVYCNWTVTSANPSTGDFTSGEMNAIVKIDGGGSGQDEIYLSTMDNGTWRMLAVQWATVGYALRDVWYVWKTPGAGNVVTGFTRATGSVLVAPAIVGRATLNGLVLSGVIDGSQSATISGTLRWGPENVWTD